MRGSWRRAYLLDTVALLAVSEQAEQEPGEPRLAAEGVQGNGVTAARQKTAQDPECRKDMGSTLQHAFQDLGDMRETDSHDIIRGKRRVTNTSVPKELAKQTICSHSFLWNSKTQGRRTEKKGNSVREEEYTWTGHLTYNNSDQSKGDLPSVSGGPSAIPICSLPCPALHLKHTHEHTHAHTHACARTHVYTLPKIKNNRHKTM